MSQDSPTDVVGISKQLSRILRHRPDSIGVALDRHGWCNIDEVLRGLADLGVPTTPELLEKVVQENDKKRFEIRDNRIRAVQGHSAKGVTPQMREKTPPSRLFHGTVENCLASIERKGLLPMRRHHVHLSQDVATAASVGNRRGNAVILVVDSLRMCRDRYKFFVTTNGIWLTDHVPAQYISRVL